MGVEVDLAKLCTYSVTQVLVARTVGDLCSQKDEVLDALLRDLEHAKTQVTSKYPIIGLRTLGIESSLIVGMLEGLITLVRAVRSVSEDTR